MQVGQPVWTLRPNWRETLTERLSWKTDVLAGDAGVEQRRSLRLSPRRSLEFTVSAVDTDRTYLDLLLHRLGSEEWLCPLWWDRTRLTAVGASGSYRLKADTRYREFAPGLALLWRSTHEWEVVSVRAVDPKGLDLDAPLDDRWTAGGSLYPLRRALMSEQSSISLASSRIGEIVMGFEVNESNDHPARLPDETYWHEGRPVLAQEPNWSQEITADHTRLAGTADNETGHRYRVDEIDRAFKVQSHGWLLRGKAARSEFRAMLYWLRGQQHAIWLPSFTRDVLLGQGADGGAVALDARRAGYLYAGVPMPGRDRLWLRDHVRGVTAVGRSTVEDCEQLALDGPTTRRLTPAHTLSWLEPARLNQDDIEITHRGEEVAEVAATFKTLREERQPPVVIHYPIPLTNRNSDPCGVPANLIKAIIRVDVMENAPPIDPIGSVGIVYPQATGIGVGIPGESYDNNGQLELAGVGNDRGTFFVYIYKESVFGFWEISFNPHYDEPFPNCVVSFVRGGLAENMRIVYEGLIGGTAPSFIGWEG